MVLRRLAAFGDSFTLDEANALVADGTMSASEIANRIVDLVASHEAGYLHHCRRYALREAA